MDKAFTFTNPDAIEIAYIMQRNRGSAVFLHKLLVHAINAEDIYITHPPHRHKATAPHTKTAAQGKGQKVISHGI